MTHLHAFKGLDPSLKDTTSMDLPKIVILGGDFRQVLPVMPHGPRYGTIGACTLKFEIWHYVHVLRLKESM